MQENNGKGFIWLFVGLFVILFAFATFNQISGRVSNKKAAPIDEMIKAIVQSDSVFSDIPKQQYQDIDEFPEDIRPYFKMEEEADSTQKLVGDLFFIYNPNTNISNLYSLSQNGLISIYDSTSGSQFSDEIFTFFTEKVEQVYAQTL
ncbi:MAG: hypothetical protein GX308_09550 [Epulopiscium sp.]|nr:hypothetical protein [Candidatus Epulonipiscium sp.]